VIRIDGLRKLLNSLDRVDLAPVQRDALAEAAQQLGTSVRESLSHPPGSDHATPWLRMGLLRDSIATEVTAEEAVVGSNSPVAVYQEHGTSAVPPRPFLAPAGAAGAETAADQVGRVLAEAVRDLLR